jgi:hypothetical protein
MLIVPLELSLMFASKAAAYLCEAISGAPLQGRVLAFPTNIKQGSKGLLGWNTQAYNKDL